MKKSFWDLMELMIESMMKTEHCEFLSESGGSKGNSFRSGRIYDQGRVLEFRVPCDRCGNFHLNIMALLRDH